MSAATEQFMVRLGLLRDNVLLHREALSIHRLQGPQAIAWVAKRAKVSYSRAILLSVWAWAFSTWQEKRNAFYMHRTLASQHADEFMRAVIETQPYRNAEEIKRLFTRLTIPIKQVHTFDNCCIVEI